MENPESGKSELAPVQPLDNRLMDMLFKGYPPEMYNRRAHALDWRDRRTAGECTGEVKICISACGGGIDQWHENLYGFPRVVVHGVDSLCVVARTKDVEDVVCQAAKANRILCNLKKALIYEAEDLALPSSAGIKMTSRSFEKPFIAVSVVPGTNSVHEASGDKYDVDSAIKFLKEEVDSGATFDFEKSVKTAMLTLQHLFCKKFMAEEIQVFYVKNHSGRIEGSTGRSGEANEFPTHRERSIDDHLAVLNKPCSGGSSSRRRLIVIDKPRSRGSPSRGRGLNVINKARGRRRFVVVDKPRSEGSPSRKRGLNVIYVEGGGSTSRRLFQRRGGSQ